MKTKNIWIIVTLIVIVILIAGALIFNTKSKQSNNPTQNQINTSKETNQLKPVAQEIVTVTGSGFNPQTLTIKVGTLVTWDNKSNVPVSVNSDDYPTNLLYRFLNLGQFANDSSVATIFTKAGRYTYHNQLNPDQRNHYC